MNLARVLICLLLVLSVCPEATAEVIESNSAGSSSESAPTLAHATVLSSIEIEHTDKETRVHLKADGVIKNYKKVQLGKNAKAGRPDRIYLDIKNMSLAGPILAKKVGTALARVRTGRRTGGFRVVFDSSLDEMFDYTIQELPDGLLVTIREPSASAPAVIADLPKQEPPAAISVIANKVESEGAEAEPEKVIAPVVETIYPEPTAVGDLKMVIVTSDSPDYAREWLEAPRSPKASLSLLKTAKTDQEISTSFLVTGLTPDNDGNYSYVISFTLLDASRKPMVNRPRYAKATGKSPAQPAFIMVEPELALVLDSSDPIGDYTMIGFVQDLINNKIVRSSTKITLAR